MSDREKYTFHIDAYSPATIPMARLAEYLSQLAGLLGNAESVHLVQVDDGSVNVVHEVEFEAIPKVRARLSLVTSLDAPEDLKKRFVQINDMLREDNAVGLLKRDSQNVVRFPGKEIRKPKKIGPFNESGKIDGVLVRIGGKDKTVHAQLMGHDDKVWSCVVDREMAREMAAHLFGAPLRVLGSARWERDEQEKWNLVAFRASQFEVLSDEDLSQVVERLRQIQQRDPSKDEDFLAVWREIRGDDEVH